MPALDINQLKQMLSIDVDDTSQDTYLSFILSSAENLTQRYTQKLLQSEDVFDIVRHNRGYIAFLTHTPVNNVQSIEIVKVVGSTTNQQILSNSVIEILDSDNGTIFWNYGFDDSIIYKIIYNAGYSQIPEDLQYAIYEIAVNMYEMTDRIKQGVDRISTPDGTVTYSKELIPQSIKEILDLYRVKV